MADKKFVLRDPETVAAEQRARNALAQRKYYKGREIACKQNADAVKILFSIVKKLVSGADIDDVDACALNEIEGRLK